MKIVTLAGGLSSERDVSFVTGSNVTAALRENGHQVILMDVFMGRGEEGEDISDWFDRSEEVSTAVSAISEQAPDIEAIKASRPGDLKNFFGPNVIRLCQEADIVFLALHGENGENGKLQAAFDLLGVKYTGSDYLSSAIAMNKGIAKQLMNANGIPTPRGMSMTRDQREDDLSKLPLHLPLVIKPCCGGSSIGVTIVRNEEEYKAGLEEGFRFEDELIIEEYVEGREFSVGVLEGKALPIIEIAPISGFYDYKNKYKAGSAVETCPAELPQEITEKMQGYAEAVAKTLGLDTYSRTDFLLNRDNEIFCLEANTLPGMTPTSLLPQEAKVVGMNFNQLCEKLIEISLAKYN